MPRAVIYCRISKDLAGEGAGVARQEAECRALCKRYGWDVAEVLVDNDVSAYSGKPRPAYERALTMIRNRDAEAFVAWAWDRITRQPMELEGFVTAIETAGADVALVQAGTVDLATPSGRAFARVLGAMSRMESEQKSVRQKSANRQRALQGKRSPTGHRPFGWSDDRVSLHPVEAPAFQRAVREVIAGRSLRSVVAEWNVDPDLWTTTGRKWDHRTMSMLMHRASNPGLAVYQGQIMRDTPAEWAPLITLAEHEAVCAVLDNPDRTTTTGPKRKHLLTGVAKCGVCGETLYHRVLSPGKRTARRHVLSCRASVNHGARAAAPIERAVEDAVLERLSQPDAADLFRARPRKPSKTAAAEVERIRRLMDRTTQDYADGVINGHQFRDASAAQATQLAVAQSKLAGEVESRVPERIRSVEPGRVKQVWDSLDILDKQAVINALMTVKVFPTSDPEHGSLPYGCLIEWI